MILRGAEDEVFFVRVDFVHEELHAFGFAFFDLDDALGEGSNQDENTMSKNQNQLSRRGEALYFCHSSSAAVNCLPSNCSGGLLRSLAMTSPFFVFDKYYYRKH